MGDRGHGTLPPDAAARADVSTPLERVKDVGLELAVAELDAARRDLLDRGGAITADALVYISRRAAELQAQGATLTPALVSALEPLVAAADLGAPLQVMARLAKLGPAFVAWCAAHDRGEDPPVVVGGTSYRLRRGFTVFEAMCRQWRDVAGMQLELMRVDRIADPSEKLERIITDSLAVARMLLGDDNVSDDAIDEWLCAWGFTEGEFLGFFNVLVSAWLLRDGLGDCYAGLDPTVTVPGREAGQPPRRFTLRFSARAVAQTLPASKAAAVGYISEAVFYESLLRAVLAKHHAAAIDPESTPPETTRELIRAIADQLGLRGLRRLMQPAPAAPANDADPNAQGAGPAPTTPGTGPAS